ncbi:Speckle-type POZ protein B [Araneus ventricosus]|uniref:Speckle-type POZ protein B n=1 Tax=Araneus ventricosus TaxID=182803 RepID=A0A4Y2SKS3_ARAVE|nr:Speckle-type POZ protein B [Araneus ventricosus]
MNSGRKEYTFFWCIENYSFCWHEIGEKLVSPPFTADGLEGTAWNLQLYPRGGSPVLNGVISLYLERSASDEGPEKALIKYELSFLAACGSPRYSVEFDRVFKRGVGYEWYTFLKIDEMLLGRRAEFLPEDILTVRCKIWKGQGNIHKMAPICARTRIGIEKISFLHVVENFSSLEPNQKHTIEIQSHSKNECFALSSLYFSCDSWLGGEMVVEITPSDSKHILSKRKISLLGSGNVIVCSKIDNRFDVRKDIQKLPLSLTRQVIQDKKSEYLHGGKLSLLCECVFSTGLEFDKIEETEHKICAASVTLHRNVYKTAEKMSAHPNISEDMKALYVNRTDVELKTQTKSFPAHKTVLCFRSPVFKAMLTNEMKERHTDCIHVDDMGDDVVQQLLFFLYSDTVENLEWEIATQLHYAADMYQVDELKELCSAFLVENLTPTNAIELLIMADAHNDIDLRKVVVDFILEHGEQIFGTEEWEMITETNPLSYCFITSFWDCCNWSK